MRQRAVTVLILVLGMLLLCTDEAMAWRKRNKRTEPRTEAAISVAEGATPILGEPQVSVDRMWEFVRAVNADFPREIAQAYYDIGQKYGVRGDIALCQSIVETGWFLFGGGTAVTPDQHNYCGLGVTSRGMKGISFESMEEGVTAQIQHLYAYACRSHIPAGESLVDPRFYLVSRGIAPSWEELNLKWAMNDRYGQSILALFRKMCGAEPIVVENIGIEIPEEYLDQ